MMLLHYAIQSFVFIAASWAAWPWGNKLVLSIWKMIGEKHGVNVSKPPSTLAPAIGGLERMLYIFGVMSGRYEILTGWLVMKAFFGWIEPHQSSSTNGKSELKEKETDVLFRYNRFLLGNILSLLIGLCFGLAANLIVDEIEGGHQDSHAVSITQN